MLRLQHLLMVLVVLMGLTASCAHLPNYAMPGPLQSPSPTPMPSPSSSASPAPCGSPLPGTTVYVVMSSSALPPIISPSYGSIFAYVAANADGTFNNQAQVINLRTTAIVQFVNADNTGPSLINHSAIGFPKAPPFPTIPFAFPTGTQLPMNSVISTAQWSTGRVAPACYSQQFTLSSGTFYFGDYDYYNLNLSRSVIVVGGSASLDRRATIRPIRFKNPPYTNP